LRLLIITIYFLTLKTFTFGQTYNSILSDKEFEEFINWEISHPQERPDIFYGFTNEQISYYSKTISWKDLIVVYEPENETVFESLFKNLFTDSIFKNLDKLQIKEQYEDDKKGLNLNFVTQVTVKWTNKRTQSKPTINYSSPLVTADKRLLIICKDYSLNNGNSKIKGEYYINVYKKTQDGWGLYKSTGGTY